MPKVLVKRGTRAQLDAAAAANQLSQGEPYLITDENKIAVGNNVNSYTVSQENLCDVAFKTVVAVGGGALSVTNIGFAGMTTVGGTARNYANTNKLTMSKRVGFVSSATAGSLSSAYWTTTAGNSYIPTDSDPYKISFNFRFNCSDAATVSGARFFAGISSSNIAPTNVEPSSITNCIGIAQLSTDATQFYLVYGGSSAQTSIGLGTVLGEPTDTTAIFHFKITMQSATAFTYMVKNLKTGVIASGVITGIAGTQIPTGVVSPRMWRCNNTTAMAVAFDLHFFYVESDV